MGFTSMSSQMSPTALVTLLNEVFSAFDFLVERLEDLQHRLHQDVRDPPAEAMD